jgi:hypothetical protein
LLSQNLAKYITIFMENSISGDKLLSMDSTHLKRVGVEVKQDRERIRERAKELKKISDKEKKRVEKERRVSAGGSSSSKGEEGKKGGKGLVSSILR